MVEMLNDLTPAVKRYWLAILWLMTWFVPYFSPCPPNIERIFRAQRAADRPKVFPA